MNKFCKSQFQDSYLQHHGVLGMKWGVRRYQPYGEGGYDPKNKGKFVGKRQQKKTFKTLVKYHKGLITSDKAKSRLKDVIDDKELKKKRQEMNKKQHEYEYTNYKLKNDSTRTRKEKDVLSIKKLEEYYDAKHEYNKAYKEYVSNVLGKYGDRKIASTVGFERSTGKDVLEELLNS